MKRFIFDKFVEESSESQLIQFLEKIKTKYKKYIDIIDNDRLIKNRKWIRPMISELIHIASRKCAYFWQRVNKHTDKESVKFYEIVRYNHMKGIEKMCAEIMK